MRTSTWRLFPPQHKTIDKGHGRIEERRIWASSDLEGFSEFPHLHQVIRVERIVTTLQGTPLRKNDIEVAYGVSDLTAEQASPAELLAFNRGHWAIENKLHHVRDRTYDEDRSQVRKRQAPQVMASLRNLAISVFRLVAGAGACIAIAVSHCSRKVRTTLRLIGL